MDCLPIILEVDPPCGSGSRAPALLAHGKTRLRADGPKSQPLPGLCFSYRLCSGQFADGAAIKTLES